MATGRDSFLTGTAVLESVVLGFTTLALGFVPNLTLDAGFATLALGFVAKLNDPPNIDSYEPSEFGKYTFAIVFFPFINSDIFRSGNG